jgi:hypothetical protein
VAPSLENKPAESQRIIYQTKQHWAILLGPVFVIFMGWLTLESKGAHSAILITFGFVWGLISYMSLRQSDIVLTNNHLVINVGFPFKRSSTISLDTITLLNYYQPSLGGILNFGKIILVHSGNEKNIFRFIARPAVLIKEIQEILRPSRLTEQP